MSHLETKNLRSVAGNSNPETLRKLSCLAEGGTVFFFVSARNDCKLATLKELVWEKARYDLFRCVSAVHLSLYKLNQPVELKPSRTLQSRVSPGILEELEEGNDTVSFLFPHSTSTDHLDIFVKITSVGGKRKREDPVDVSIQLLEKWNVPLPAMLSVANLTLYLNASLDPEEKIPISDREWRRLLQPNRSLSEHFCSAEDLGVLFTKNEDETADVIWPNVFKAILQSQPNLLGTENSFIAFWDCNILHIFLACLDEPKWIRNSNRGTHTGSLGPGLGLFLRLACVFRGQEKQPMFTGKHPRQELAEITRWVYDPAAYVLGYYAVGADITLVAIQRSVDAQGKQQIVIKDIARADLSTRRGRIGNVVRMIKLVKVLRTLESIVAKDVDVDMFPVNLDDGKSIEFLKTKIRKEYRSEDLPRVSFLKSVYGHLEAKGVPNVDHLTRFETSHPEYGCFVELEPRGIDTGPTSAGDVTNAVVSILEALKILHAPEPRIFHRDIRWSNVMQSVTDPKKWFLIDWEDAAIAPTKAALNLRPETHAPQVFEDGHGAEVDIWGVGSLIATANVSGLSENLRSLGRRMVDGSVISAEQGLVELKAV